ARSPSHSQAGSILIALSHSLLDIHALIHASWLAPCHSRSFPHSHPFIFTRSLTPSVSHTHNHTHTHTHTPTHTHTHTHTPTHTHTHTHTHREREFTMKCYQQPNNTTHTDTDFTQDSFYCVSA